jgi:hypothetical protein
VAVAVRKKFGDGFFLIRRGPPTYWQAISEAFALDPDPPSVACSGGLHGSGLLERSGYELVAGETTMSLDANKALARRFFEEVWNKRNLDVIADVFAPTVSLNGRDATSATIRGMVEARLAAFPDIRVTIEEQVAEGDCVSTRRTGKVLIEARFEVSHRQESGRHGRRSASSVL